MKLKLSFVSPSLGRLAGGLGVAGRALALAGLIGLAGCASEEEDIVPTKKPGFRPPSGPLVQDDLPPIDPLAGASNDVGGGASSSSTPSGGGFQGSAEVGSRQPGYQPAPEAPPQPPPPPAPTKPRAPRPEMATKVPGEPGFIYSPYDGKKLDARGQPPGTEVRDPHDPAGRILIVP